MNRIIVCVTNDLSTDQRVHKVCTSLERMGFQVCLIGRRLPNSMPLARSYQTKRMQLLFNKGPLFYAEYNIRLFLMLLLSNYQLTLANDMDTLPSAFLATKLRGKTLVFDAHELFSEVPEVQARPKVRAFWQSLEKRFLPKVKHAYTVCQSIADYYGERYGIAMKVVRNLPKKSNEKSDIIKREQIILYQGAVNLGRGLDVMIHAMHHIDKAVLWIVGGGDEYERLTQLVREEKLSEKVRFFGRMKFEALKEITPQASVGISIEENIGLNYYYALPNKLFDYINNGIPVLVSDFPEMARIVDHYNIGCKLKKHEAKVLATTINKMLADKAQMTTWASNCHLAAKELNWETEEKVLEAIYKPLLK